LNCSQSFPVWAWSDHTSLTFYTLENSSPSTLEKNISVETIQNFLEDMKKNHPGELSKSIQKTEDWAKQNGKQFRPIPENIFYKENQVQDENLTTAFFHGIRINPNMVQFPYVRDFPSSYLKDHPQFKNLWDPKKEIHEKEVTISTIGDSSVPDLRYFKVDNQQIVPALVVLATAADDPDLGLDINLFENNNTNFGKIYKFGNQPFGDPRVGFSTQAAFHYGAYQEWKIFYALAPQTKESYAAYRIKLYRELAKTAFAAGHEYWGWKFLGFGLHYLQDITQPYHAHFFPGYNTMAMISYYALSLVGFKKPLENKINLVANRHFLFEDFVHRLLENPQLPDSVNLQQTLNKVTEDEKNINYQDNYPQDIVSKNTIQYADDLSNTLVENFPAKYANDPNLLYEDKKVQILEVFQNLSTEKRNKLMEITKRILGPTGQYTRAYLKDFMH
jgi:hypothetical protein